MTTFAKVVLEILRHGPPHNQLLSPLTRYLALCGGHAATSLEVPFEHGELEGRLLALRYEGSDDAFGPRGTAHRELHLDEMAERMGRLLGCLPALGSEMSRLPDGDDAVVHLELVLSAHELSLLPFELARTPAGWPGAGQPLLLQPRPALCLTRRVRRAEERAVAWSRTPRILFAWAAPPGAGDDGVPHAEHRAALAEALAPWLRLYGDDGRALGADEALREHLVVLERASIGALAEACRHHRFTHVHLLAHGLPLRRARSEGFGLGLHDDEDPGRLAVVSGHQLASALRGRHRPDEGFAAPAVVTLASCDSGAVGSVVSAGGSLAHAVHEAGVPLVVASQFPLTFAASVTVARRLYEQLLRGADPRLVLAELRRGLHATLPAAHDWASLVAYAALPDDLDHQLATLRARQAHRAATVALLDADRVVRVHRETGRAPDAGELAAIERQLDAGLAWLEELLPSTVAHGERHVDVAGLLGSVLKRRAEVLRAAHGTSPEATEATRRPVAELLGAALGAYRRAYQRDLAASWAMVQYLTVAAALGRAAEPYRRLWHTAAFLSEKLLAHGDDRERRWALAAVSELHALVPALFAPGVAHDAARDDGDDVPDAETAERLALDAARRLRDSADDDDPDVYAARRQMRRFGGLFRVPPGSFLDHGRGDAGPAGAARTREIADRVVAVLARTRL